MKKLTILLLLFVTVGAMSQNAKSIHQLAKEKALKRFLEKNPNMRDNVSSTAKVVKKEKSKNEALKKDKNIKTVEADDSTFSEYSKKLYQLKVKAISEALNKSNINEIEKLYNYIINSKEADGIAQKVLSIMQDQTLKLEKIIKTAPKPKTN